MRSETETREKRLREELREVRAKASVASTEAAKVLAEAKKQSVAKEQTVAKATEARIKDLEKALSEANASVNASENETRDAFIKRKKRENETAIEQLTQKMIVERAAHANALEVLRLERDDALKTAVGVAAFAEAQRALRSEMSEELEAARVLAMKNRAIGEKSVAFDEKTWSTAPFAREIMRRFRLTLALKRQFNSLVDEVSIECVRQAIPAATTEMRREMREALKGPETRETSGGLLMAGHERYEEAYEGSSYGVSSVASSVGESDSEFSDSRNGSDDEIENAEAANGYRTGAARASSFVDVKASTDVSDVSDVSSVTDSDDGDRAAGRLTARRE